MKNRKLILTINGKPPLTAKELWEKHNVDVDEHFNANPSTPNKLSVKNFNHKFQCCVMDRLSELIYRKLVPHKRKDRTQEPTKTV